MPEREHDELDPAHVEGVFRAANEDIERKRAELDGHLERAPYLCECEDTQCREILLLEPAEYGRIRADDRLFVIAPRHPAGERAEIVAREDAHWVARKPEEEARVAREAEVP